jgi:hypothetical protein
LELIVEPPKSVIGQILTGSLALAAGAWAGAALNSRSVASKTPAAATAAAALGAVTGSMLTLFGAAALAVGDSKWRRLAATTTVLGVGGFAALSLVGLKMNDRMLSSSAGQPIALLAFEKDSGGFFTLAIGDTLTVELPIIQGYAWKWSPLAAGEVVSGPASTTLPVEGGAVEHDTFTGVTAGSVTLSASLAPAAGGAAAATWSAQVTVA